MSSRTDMMMLRPMGLLEIVDQTFRLYRRNFGVFFGIAAVVYVPWGVLQGIPIVNVLAGILAAPLALIAQAALTKAVSDRYLGRSSGVGEAYGYIGRRFWPLALTMILAYLLVIGGFFLLVIPGIVFLFWISLVSQVFVIEGKEYGAAIWRSKFLIGKGTWAELMVLGLIVGILATIVQAVAGMVVGVPLFGGFEEGGAVPIQGAVLFGLVQALALPLGQIATVLLYYDSRIRKEGFDLEVLAREMGAALPPPPGQAADVTAEAASAPPQPPAEPQSLSDAETDREGA